jgi:hypothetical protein
MYIDVMVLISEKVYTRNKVSSLVQIFVGIFKCENKTLLKKVRLHCWRLREYTVGIG